MSETSAENQKPVRSRNEILTIWSPAVLISLIGFGVAWFFVEPAPGNQLKIATGSSSGIYYETAQKYAEIFKREGIDLEIVETAGTVQNYDLLKNDPSIHLAIVQGGTVAAKETFDLEAIASLYFEPLWIFHRSTEDFGRLHDLQKKRVSIGPEDSGTQELMLRLLEANGLIQDHASPETSDKDIELFVESAEAGIDMLLSGERDAICLVTSPANPMVKQLFENPQFELLPVELNQTYRLLFPALSGIELQAGILDLPNHIPDENMKLIAPAANLVCTPALHDAFIPLLLRAAAEVHAEGDLLVSPREFPSLEFVEFPVHESALDYFQSGPSFLNRYLPFWAASFIQRTKIMIVPLLTLAIPLIKLAPPVYRWRIRSRIYRWYGLLREIDQEHLESNSEEQKERHLKKLNEMARELSEVNVPLSYMEEFYNLHLHIDLIRRHVLSQQTLIPLNPDEDKKTES